MSTNNPESLNLNPTENETYKRWSRISYPEAPNREALQNWLMRQFNKDNAAKLYLMLKDCWRNHELGEALKKRVIECGWVFGKIKRMTVVEIDGRMPTPFESYRHSKWRSDNEEGPHWEVLIRADKLGKDVTKVPDSWCVTLSKPR